MITITKPFLYWYFPDLGNIEDVLGHLELNSPTQIGELVGTPLQLGEARHHRISAVANWIHKQAEVSLGYSTMYFHHDPRSKLVSVGIPNRFGSIARCLLTLPKSVEDYILCRGAPTISPAFNVVEASAVAALALAEGIEPKELVRRAVLAYMVSNSGALLRHLDDSEDVLGRELRRQGFHPEDFKAVFKRVTPLALAGRPLAVA